jgi:hypothetical protein
MRTFAVLAIAVLTSGCLAPGQPDPTRYPWDQPPPTATFCVVALEPASTSGITVGRDRPALLGCSAPKAASRNFEHARPILPPLPYCVVPSSAWVTDGKPTELRTDCVRPGLGADSPLGPAYVSRELGNGITQTIKLRDLTPQEVAALQPKKPQRPAFPQPVVPARSEAEQFSADCAVHEARLQGPIAEYGIRVADDGSAQVENYLKFYMISQDRRYALLWDLAFHVSCAAGRRMMTQVSLVTPKGKMIHHNRISTELICHGFKHIPPWDQPWYLC